MFFVLFCPLASVRSFIRTLIDNGQSATAAAVIVSCFLIHLVIVAAFAFIRSFLFNWSSSLRHEHSNR